MLTTLTTGASALSDRIDALQDTIVATNHNADALTIATYERDVVIPAMADLRREADILESLTDKSYWPYPTYSDLLFY